MVIDDNAAAVTAGSNAATPERTTTRNESCAESVADAATAEVNAAQPKSPTEAKLPAGAESTVEPESSADKPTFIMRVTLNITFKQGREETRQGFECGDLCLNIGYESDDLSEWDYFDVPDVGRLPSTRKVEKVLDAESLPIKEDGTLKAVKWKMGVAWLIQYRDFAAKPTWKDGVLDFGVLDIDLLALLGDDAWLAIGRISHVTGAPAANNNQFSLRRGDPEEKSNNFDIRTGADGVFLVVLDVFDPAEKTEWRLHDDDKFRDDDELREIVLTPQLEGRVLNFEIVLGCAMVQFEVEGLLSEKERRDRAKTREYDETLWPYSLTMSFSFSNPVTRVHVFYLERAASGTVFLTRGLYEYEATVSDDFARYQGQDGILVAVDGKVTQLKVVFKLVKSVVLEVVLPDGSNPHPLRLKVKLVDALTKELCNEQVFARAPLLEYPAGQLMEVEVWADGWAPVKTSVPPDCVSFEIRLSQKGDSTKGLLRVKIPECPDGASKEDLALYVTAYASGNEERWDVIGGFTYSAGETKEKYLEPGEWKLVIEEVSEAYWGYPGGIASGPIAVTIQAGKTTEVTLPAFGPPPWKKPVKGCVAMLTCEGRPISYDGPGKQGERGTNLAFPYGAVCEYPADSYAIVDGEQQVPLELRPPGDDAPKPSFVHDFECRVEVRVTRNGKATVEPFQVEGAMTSASASCYAQSTDGSPAFLWLPVGEATVSLDQAPAPELKQSVEVRRGERAVVVFDKVVPAVKLIWDDKYATDKGTSWFVITGDGSALCALTPGQPSVKIEAGRHTARPALAADNAADIVFEVVLWADNELRLPFHPVVAMMGSLLLPYPEGLKRDPGGYVLLGEWFCTAFGGMNEALARHKLLSLKVIWRLTNDGLRITGLPLDTEVCVVAAIANNGFAELPSPKAWSVGSLQVKLTSTETKVIAGAWAAAAVLDSNWRECEKTVWFAVAGSPLEIEYTSRWTIIPTGEYDVEIYEDSQENSRTVTRRLSFAPGLVRMPEDLLKELRDLGWMKPSLPAEPKDG
ncbi:MAG: hypothetical protein IT462_07315 [Planctomycetes bacterium]|nr:hypothetical protein [Planctomycetota bacterium]